MLKEYLIYNNIRKVSEDGTGSRSPSIDVGDVGVPPYLTFLNYRKRVLEIALFKNKVEKVM